MKDTIQSLIGHIIFSLIWCLKSIIGIERIKKIGYCLIRKTENKPCDQCGKINIFRKETRNELEK